ncbi:MAG TPA: class I SAM-dependent methyltransferase, partial [Thermoanaerobaculia bacterium]|nr:class I SAM-dependent methyltransferase [Thermoanaerobaculia bacterium]
GRLRSMSEGDPSASGKARWEDPGIIAEFAAREPDLRLVDLLDAAADPSTLRVLDLGCAAGRNTDLLARRGCSVVAIDLSAPMVEATRRRLAPILGEDEASRRVFRGSMTDLRAIADGSFDLVVALGIYHQAADLDEWTRAIGETARVLAPGGRILLAQFGPGTDLTGEHGGRVSGEDHVFVIREGSPAVLFDAAELDRRMGELGFEPLAPTETVERPHEPAGRRVTINALYRKR